MRWETSLEDRLEDMAWLLEQGVCEADLIARMPFSSAHTFEQLARGAGRTDLVHAFQNRIHPQLPPLGIPRYIKSKHYESTKARPFKL